MMKDLILLALGAVSTLLVTTLIGGVTKLQRRIALKEALDKEIERTCVALIMNVWHIHNNVGTVNADLADWVVENLSKYKVHETFQVSGRADFINWLTKLSKMNEADIEKACQEDDGYGQKALMSLSPTVLTFLPAKIGEIDSLDVTTQALLHDFYARILDTNVYTERSFEWMRRAAEFKPESEEREELAKNALLAQMQIAKKHVPIVRIAAELLNRLQSHRRERFQLVCVYGAIAAVIGFLLAIGFGLLGHNESGRTLV